MPKKYTESDYEIACSFIDLDWDEASHDFQMMMNSMGWSKQPKKVVDCAQNKLRNDAWTKEDAENLAEIISDLRKEGMDEEKILYHNKVEDYRANFIANYMLKALNACKKRRK